MIGNIQELSTLCSKLCCRRIAVADNAEPELTLVTLVAIDNEPVSLKDGFLCRHLL